MADFLTYFTTQSHISQFEQPLFLLFLVIIFTIFSVFDFVQII